MKKARVLLASLVLLGVIGGTLAFKAKSKFAGVFFTTLYYDYVAYEYYLGKTTLASPTAFTAYTTLIEGDRAVVSTGLTGDE